MQLERQRSSTKQDNPRRLKNQLRLPLGEAFCQGNKEDTAYGTDP